MINLPFDRALIVRAPHVDNILDNGKIIEIRSRKTNVRGRVGLIESGTGLIVGEVNIDGCSDSALTPKQMIDLSHLHQVDDLELLKKWRYPWYLSNAIRYDQPIPYDHPKGAVIWVRI